LQISNSGFAEFTNAIADPAIVAPLAPIKVMRMSSGFSRFVYGGAFSAAVTAPSELIKQSQLEGHTLGHTAVALTGATLIGGALTKAFGGAPLMSTHTAKQIYKSAGASVSPEKAREAAYATMEGDALASTGIGVEKLPWNPVIRMMASPNPIVRSLAAGMVDVGGLIQNKVKDGDKMEQSVETTFRTTWLPGLIEAIRASDEAYLSYRGIVAKEGDVGRSMQMLGTGIKDTFKRGRNYLNEVEFRIRVGRAMRNGDVDEINDSATGAVNKAATAYRKQFDLIKNETTNLDMFRKSINAQIKTATNAGDMNLVAKLEDKLKEINEKGITLNTAKSYLPRVYRVDRILENQDEFVQVVSKWAKVHYSVNDAQASKIAKDIMDEVTRSKPYLDLDEVADQFDWISSPSGTKARTFEIPDKLIDKFLESDAEVLLRHHTKTMGMDIELTRKFGEIDMRSVIEEVSSEYQRLIDETSDLARRRALKKSLEDDLRDIRGLRDRLRGTYGASKDPHAMASRFIRVMKSFNVLVGMGGAVVSSVPDVVRTVMVEGVENTYSKGMKHMFKQSGSQIKKMQKKEMRQAAIAVDAVLGLRSAAFSDVGDLFGARFGIERKLNQSTATFFMLNGLNYWNQALKEFAGNVTTLRMTEGIMKPWSRLSRSDKEKFLKNGIDEQDHGRMQALIKQHGERVDGEWMPNTELWGDSTMRTSFRNALNQNVERIIVTPGAGDRALWTSRELGSLLTQFKSYGQGAMVRVLTSGLQEKDAAFWQGAFLMIGLASLVNEFKRMQYGIKSDEDFDEKLINAIDRSGVLGWFTDVNNSIEKISDFNVGVRPAFTDENINYMPGQAKLASAFGPTVNTVLNTASVAGDVISGNVDATTGKNTRFITPYSNIPYMDPAFDVVQRGIFGE